MILLRKISVFTVSADGEHDASANGQREPDSMTQSSSNEMCFVVVLTFSLISFLLILTSSLSKIVNPKVNQQTEPDRT
jgi:hypothetical protein